MLAHFTVYCGWQTENNLCLKYQSLRTENDTDHRDKFCISPTIHTNHNNNLQPKRTENVDTGIIPVCV